MKNTAGKIVFIGLIVTTLSYCSSSRMNKSRSSKNENSSFEFALKHVLSNLEKARFQPIRTGWTHDYGFDYGGTLNTFEYVRSLMTYEELQKTSKHAIFLKGPHSSTSLNLNSNTSFGYYNPAFVNYLNTTLKKILRNEAFIELSRPSIIRFNILNKLKGYLEIYDLIEEDRDVFNKLRTNFEEKLAMGVWSSYDYRSYLPPRLETSKYWNWSETVYYFWVRRAIDGTKELWHQLIIDFIAAYES